MAEERHTPENGSADHKHRGRRPRGRPSIYTDATADEILSRISEGETLLDICKHQGMPCRATIHSWVADDLNGFAARHARARESQAAAAFDAALDVARAAKDMGHDRVAGYRLAWDALRWHASKLDPKNFGNRQQIEHTGRLA